MNQDVFNRAMAKIDMIAELQQTELSILGRVLKNSKLTIDANLDNSYDALHGREYYLINFLTKDLACISPIPDCKSFSSSNGSLMVTTKCIKFI